MTLRITAGAAGQADTGRLLVDARESFNGFGDAINTNPGTDHRGDVTQFNGGGTAMKGQLLGTTAGVAMVFDAAAGLWVRQLPSAAARTVLTAMGSSPYKVPMYQRFSDPASLPISLRGWPLLQYTFEVPVRVAVVGTAEVEIGFVTSNGMLNMLGVNTGAVWSSDPAVNAGAWTPKSRRVSGGAQVVGPSSGIIPTAATWNLMAVRYTEGAVPTIEFLIDTVPLHTISGDANMPVVALPFGGTNFNFGPGIGINTPAGRTLETAAARFTIEEL